MACFFAVSISAIKARLTPARLAAGLALFCAALAVRAWGLPLERQVFDGHERDYLLAFQGLETGASLQVYPGLAALYRALGALTPDPRALLGLNLFAGALTAPLAGLAVGRSLGERAGWIAGALVALSPSHVAWSASAYNVALPQLLLVGALAARGAWGAPLYALACASRVELALLAPAVAWLAGWRCALGALGALTVAPLLPQGPELRPLSLTLPANLRLTGLIGPLGAPLGLAAVGLAARRESLPWLAAAAWCFLASAAFDDQGDRHLLFAAMALGAVLGAARGWRLGALALGLGLQVHGLLELRERFYSGNAAFRASLPDLGPPPGDCVEVLDDPLGPESHWAYRAQGWPEGRLCWGEEAIHHAWTSRGLHDRALRMKQLYEAVPIGITEMEHGPRLVWELHP
ncbi:MAG: hypothetical protein H6741_21570 [Alphaproteobacteria bacterium]|nr:hypothetical protein [Alphaproteobacteria bacterium]